MAQIIKYKNGGANSKTYGTFTIDDVTYDVNDDFLHQLAEYGKTLRPDVGNQFKHIIDAARDGKDINYSSVGDGTLTGDVVFNLSNKQHKRMSRSRSGAGRFFGSVVHGKEQDAREAISALKNFSYTKPTPTKHIYDWSSDINLEYEKDDKGKYVLNNNNKKFIRGAESLRAISRLNALKNISGYEDDSEFRGYTGDRDSALEKKDYINFYNKYGEQGIQDLIKRIEDGSLNTSDIEVLNDIGILIAPETSDEEIREQEGIVRRQREAPDPEAAELAKLKAAFSSVGLNYDRDHQLFSINGGSIGITDPTLRQIIGNAGDVWLNKSFKRAFPQYSSLISGNGYFIIDGKIYSADDLETLSKLPKFQQFVRENRETAGNSPSILQYWSENEDSGLSNLNRDANGNPVYYNQILDNEYGRDVSGYYKRGENDPFIFRMFNVNPDDSSSYDNYGVPLESRIYYQFFDPVTKKAASSSNAPQFEKETDQSKIEQYYQNPNWTIFNPYYQLKDTDNLVRVVSKTGDQNNPNVGVTLYYNPNSGQYYFNDLNPGDDNFILNSRLSSDEDNMRDYMWALPKELGQYLETHKELLTDPRVKNAISSYIRNFYVTDNSFRRDNDFEFIRNIDPNLYNILINAKASLAGNNYFNNRENPTLRAITSAEGLENAGLAYLLNNVKMLDYSGQRTPYFKQGGILKFEDGDKVSTARSRPITATQEPVQKTDQKFRKIGESKVIGDGSEMTATDWWELGQLVADGVALGATAVPGLGNIAGGVVGAGSSLVGFGTDWAKDGLDWGDAGNLGMNLLLDLAGVIPGVGSVVKAGKLAKVIKGSKALGKLLLHGVNLGNTGEAVRKAYNNVINGDDWTISDIRTILNGVRGAVNFNRTKGSAIETPAKPKNTTTLKSTSEKLPEIQLTTTEIETISKLPKGEQIGKLEELIKSKLPEGTDTSTISDIIKEYNITPHKFGFKHPLTFSNKGVVRKEMFEFDMENPVYRNPSRSKWLNRRASIRDAKTNENNPYHKVYVKSSNTNVTPIIYGDMVHMPFLNEKPNEYSLWDPNSTVKFYKKGGKMLKADNGIKLAPKSGRTESEIKNNWDELASIKTISKHVSNPFDDAYQETPKTPNIRTSNASSNSNSQQGTSSFGKVMSSIGKKALGVLSNKDMLLGAADFLTSSNAIKKSNQSMRELFEKKAFGSQKQMPQEFYPRYSDNGIFRLAKDRIDTMRLNKTVTSDPNRSMAEQLMRDMKADDITKERDLQYTQSINQYNDKTLGLKQQYSNMRTQIANENKKNWSNSMSAIDMINANETQQRAQNWKNMIYQLRQNNASDRNRKYAAEDKLRSLNAQTQTYNDLLDEFNKLGGFSSWDDATKKTYGNNWQGYMQSTHPELTRNIVNKHQFNMVKGSVSPERMDSWFNQSSSPLDIERVQLNTPPQMPKSVITREKRGGKLGRIRPVDEQAYLDQQKAINKAINNLNNNIIKIFLKMM